MLEGRFKIEVKWSLWGGGLSWVARGSLGVVWGTLGSLWGGFGEALGKLWGSFVICLHPVAMDEAEVKEMKDSLQQKVTATEVKVAIATAKKEIQDQFFRLTRALEGKVDQSFGDALSGAARERERERERERKRTTTKTNYINKSRE